MGSTSWTPGRRAFLTLILSITAFTESGRSMAAETGGNPEALGYTTAELVATSGELSVYRIGVERNKHMFAVVKPYGPDERILDYIDSGEKGFRDTPILHYGPITIGEFERHVAPHVEPTGPFVQVEIRYYAKNETFAYRNAPPGLRRVSDPASRRLATPPLAVATLIGQRTGDGYNWISGHPRKGVIEGMYNTVAEVRAAYEKSNPSAQARVHPARARSGAARSRPTPETNKGGRVTATAGPSDPRNPLEEYGYPNATLLLTSGKTRYYATVIDGIEHRVVALHAIGPNDPLVEVDVKSGDYFLYRAARTAFVNARLGPKVRAHWPNTEAMSIHHFVAGEHLADSLRFEIKVRPRVKYEQPLLQEEFDFEEDGTWKPTYIARNRSADLANRLHGGRALTLADARRRRDAERAEVAEKERFANLSREEQIAESRAQKLVEEQDRRQGIVYKSERFWAGMENFYIPRKTFEGDFDAFEIRSKFPSQYLTFVAHRSNRCARTIRNPVTIHRGWDDVTYENGIEVNRVEQRFEITMDRRFLSKYEEYERISTQAQVNTVFSTILNAGSSQGLTKGMGQMFTDVYNTSVSWRQFFDKTECDSATVTQMGENFLRAARGEPSLQAAGLRLANAEAESESNVASKADMTFFDACFEYRQFRKRDWCSCVESRAKRVLRPDEMTRFTRDFTGYMASIRTPPNPRPPANHDYWRLSDPIRGCER